MRLLSTIVFFPVALEHQIQVVDLVWILVISLVNEKQASFQFNLLAAHDVVALVHASFHRLTVQLAAERVTVIEADSWRQSGPLALMQATHIAAMVRLLPLRRSLIFGQSARATLLALSLHVAAIDVLFEVRFIKRGTVFVLFRARLLRLLIVGLVIAVFLLLTRSLAVASSVALLVVDEVFGSRGDAALRGARVLNASLHSLTSQQSLVTLSLYLGLWVVLHNLLHDLNFAMQLLLLRFLSVLYLALLLRGETPLEALDAVSADLVHQLLVLAALLQELGVASEVINHLFQLVQVILVRDVLLDGEHFLDELLECRQVRTHNLERVRSSPVQAQIRKIFHMKVLAGQDLVFFELNSVLDGDKRLKLHLTALIMRLLLLLLYQLHFLSELLRLRVDLHLAQEEEHVEASVHWQLVHLAVLDLNDVVVLACDSTFELRLAGHIDHSLCLHVVVLVNVLGLFAA